MAGSKSSQDEREASTSSVDRFLLALEGDESRARLVRSIRKERSRRNEFFPGHLFSDPAWDMLLELYSAELEQRRITVTGLSDASSIPLTTGLRWLAALNKEGLVCRYCDPLDRRRVYVKLSAKGLCSLSGFFGGAPIAVTLV